MGGAGRRGTGERSEVQRSKKLREVWSSNSRDRMRARGEVSW